MIRERGAVADRALAAVAGTIDDVRRVRRPETAHSPEFDLAYVRSGPTSNIPAVIIPGGPGLASILPYKRTRRAATKMGLDLIMVEHRGVGLSRAATNGKDLPQSAMWAESVVDDIAAVLDREGAQKAVIAGSSYGSYVASSFGAQYPERVAGMLLDSALQSSLDVEVERKEIRTLFWDSKSELARLVRALTERGENQRVLLDVVRAGYELCGKELTQRTLSRRLHGRKSQVWNLLANYAARDASMVGIAGFYEFARAGAIGFRELHYAPPLDGGPLDPALTYSQIADQFPPFVGEKFNLLAAAENFTWPVALVVGDRDVRTPAVIARRTAALARRSSLVEINNGHSALDTHELAFLGSLKLLTLGREAALPGFAERLNGLPRRGAGAAFAKILSLTDRFESQLPV